MFGGAQVAAPTNVNMAPIGQGSNAPATPGAPAAQSPAGLNLNVDLPKIVESFKTLQAQDQTQKPVAPSKEALSAATASLKGAGS